MKRHLSDLILSSVHATIIFTIGAVNVPGAYLFKYIVPLNSLFVVPLLAYHIYQIIYKIIPDLRSYVGENMKLTIALVAFLALLSIAYLIVSIFFPNETMYSVPIVSVTLLGFLIISVNAKIATRTAIWTLISTILASVILYLLPKWSFILWTSAIFGSCIAEAEIIIEDMFVVTMTDSERRHSHYIVPGVLGTILSILIQIFAFKLTSQVFPPSSDIPSDELEQSNETVDIEQGATEKDKMIINE